MTDMEELEYWLSRYYRSRETARNCLSRYDRRLLGSLSVASHIHNVKREVLRQDYLRAVGLPVRDRM